MVNRIAARRLDPIKVAGRYNRVQIRKDDLARVRQAVLHALGMETWKEVENERKALGNEGLFAFDDSSADTRSIQLIRDGGKWKCEKTLALAVRPAHWIFRGSSSGFQAHRTAGGCGAKYRIPSRLARRTQRVARSPGQPSASRRGANLLYGLRHRRRIRREQYRGAALQAP